MQKFQSDSLVLIQNFGVEGDAHAGKTVKHRSRVAKDPTQPNLRQIHLVARELLEELSLKGFKVNPGEMGENVLTSGIDLINLPKDTILHLGPSAQVLITGLRNPCYQLDGIQNGLMQAVLDKDESGNLIRKAGIMGIILEGGTVVTDDDIRVEYPTPPYTKLDRV